MSDKKTIERRFAEFHMRNPHVFDLFRRYALMALRKGYVRYSAKAIFERVRWEINI